MRTLEIKKKLSFADYLLNRSYAIPYPQGAVKHIMEAANMIVVDISGLEETKLGPQVVHNRLNKLDKKEAKEFSEFYLNLWKMTKSKDVSKETAKDALDTVRKFVEWAEKESIAEELEE
jgi:hypothetical protein